MDCCVNIGICELLPPLQLVLDLANMISLHKLSELLEFVQTAACYCPNYPNMPGLIACCSLRVSKFHFCILLRKQTIFPCLHQTQPEISMLAESLSLQDSAVLWNRTSSCLQNVLFSDMIPNIYAFRKKICEWRRF